ncbi:hypothetical protein AD952_09260 [Acetobacter cerevisiae]|uniref:Polymer-forming cytoskeletal protein n=1 Tax=Acetobacter cerevisiae TaxID=178900 RepID=A0A149UU83_9PROT|nr:hypothetical protein [Acetobacter cerevisiae]KXV71403.1 hypothetical protein AD952_09260 [Acetobacter cerevisiae]
MTQTVERNAPKKYELTDETTKSWDGRTLHRIRALVAIAAFGVSVGDLGGFIEAETNLKQYGNAWVSGDAQVFGDAQVSGNAWVSGNARVSGDAQVSGNAWVSGNARVSGDAQVFGNAWVSGDAQVFGDAQVYGDARVSLSVHIGWFSSVGSEAGTLTYFRQKDGSIYTNRGCFSGTLDEFESAVDRRHGDSRIGREYDLLIQFIRLRASAWEEIQQEAA